MAKEGYGAYLSLLHPLQTIYLAGGCFWGTEHFLKQVHGVKATQVGYANGHTPHPSYHEVCTDTTGFAETVKVEYDPSEVSLAFLLDFILGLSTPLQSISRATTTERNTEQAYTTPTKLTFQRLKPL